MAYRFYGGYADILINVLVCCCCCCARNCTDGFGLLPRMLNPRKIGFCPQQLPHLHGFEGFGRNQVGFGSQGGRSEVIASVQVFVVEDRSSS